MTRLLARLLGKRICSYDSGTWVIGYSWFGVLYVTDVFR